MSLLESTISRAMLPATAAQNGGKGVVRIFVARSIAVLEFRHGVEHRRRRLRFLVRAGLVLRRMTPGAIRFIGRITTMRCAGNRLVIADMAQFAIGIEGHAQTWMGLVVRRDVHVGADRRPCRRRVALFARLRCDKMGRRLGSCKSRLVAVGTVSRHAGMGKCGRRPCRGPVAGIAIIG